MVIDYKRRMNKEGAYQYLIISILLGLIVVGIVFSWIFGEGFTSEDVDFEACRQSIVARSTLPDVAVAGVDLGSFKDQVPLKCKTNVVTIDYEDKGRAEKVIFKSMIQCWQIMGNGEYSIYPAEFGIDDSYCYNCARIHFAPEVKDFYAKSENVINIQQGLNGEFRDGISYKNYLISNDKNRFLAHDSYKDDFNVDLRSTIGHGDDWWSPAKGDWWVPFIYYPKTLDVSKGDFYVTTSSLVHGAEETQTNLLFYSWNDGDVLKALGEQSRLPLGIETFGSASICGQWDGIPA